MVAEVGRRMAELIRDGGLVDVMEVRRKWLTRVRVYTTDREVREWICEHFEGVIRGDQPERGLFWANFSAKRSLEVLHAVYSHLGSMQCVADVVFELQRRKQFSRSGALLTVQEIEARRALVKKLKEVRRPFYAERGLVGDRRTRRRREVDFAAETVLAGGETVSYGELVTRVRSQGRVNMVEAKRLVTKAVKSGVIERTGEAKTRGSVYRLVGPRENGVTHCNPLTD